MKKVITLTYIGTFKSKDNYRIFRRKRPKVKIRNNPKRKGRVYND